MICDCIASPAPKLLPTKVTTPRLNPYGIIIKKSPKATTNVYAAIISSLCSNPDNSSKICIFVFSRSNINTPGIAKIKNSFRLSKTLMVGQYQAPLISFYIVTYVHRKIIVNAAVIL